MPLQRALAAVKNMNTDAARLIRLPGVTFDIFAHPDRVTGDRDICIAITEQNYYRLERQAQERGKSVDDYLYSELAPQLEAHGYRTTRDCFYVTDERPEDYIGPPPPIKRTAH